MAYFGENSENNIKQLHPIWVLILREAILIYNFSVIDSLRNKQVQNVQFEAGASHLKYPDSKHNYTRDPNFPDPLIFLYSDAVDLIPYPAGHNDLDGILFLSGLIIGVGAKYGVKIRWGGAWDGDLNKINNKPGDYYDPWHYEIVWEG